MMMMGLCVCEFLLAQLLNSSFAIHRRQQIENVPVALEITTSTPSVVPSRYKRSSSNLIIFCDGRTFCV